MAETLSIWEFDSTFTSIIHIHILGTHTWHSCSDDSTPLTGCHSRLALLWFALAFVLQLVLSFALLIHLLVLLLQWSHLQLLQWSHLLQWSQQWSHLIWQLKRKARKFWFLVPTLPVLSILILFCKFLCHMCSVSLVVVPAALDMH